MFKHTRKAGEDKSGNAAVAINLEETKELKDFFEDCQGDTVSVRSILKKMDGHQQRNTSECDVVAMRKDTSAQEKEKDHRFVFISGDPKPIAIQTFLW